MIDWRLMTGEQIIEIVCSAPVVMHPWQAWGGYVVDEVGDHWFFSRHSDARLYPFQGGTKSCSVQRSAGPQWGWSMGYGPNDYKSGFGSAAEAIADADREMRARGWVLIGDAIR